MVLNAHVRDDRKKTNPIFVVMFVLLAVFALVLISLLIWSIVISFKDERTLETLPASMKDSYLFPSFLRNNFFVALQGLEVDGNNILQMFLYSCLFAFGSALTMTVTSCFTAYFTARYPCRYSKIVYTLVIISMTIPFIGRLPSQIQIAQGNFFGVINIFKGMDADTASNFTLYGNIWGLWIMEADFLNMYFLVFFAHFKKMPKDYFEAAEIDGASPFKTLCRVAMPMTKTLFFTVFLLNFINLWNDYQTPLVFMKKYPTISRGVLQVIWGNVGTSEIMRQLAAGIAGSLTAIVIMFLPPLIIFLILHKRLMGSLTVGGIKG